MRRLLFLLSFLALVAVGCSDDEPTTVTAGDDTEDTSVEEVMEDESGSIAEDSPPVEVIDIGPGTTAPWDVTLEEYPLLRLLDDSQNVSIGHASFVLTNQDGSPTLSGSDDHPAFVVNIDGWYGEVNYIEFTISTANALLVDGQTEQFQCGDNWARLAASENDSFVRRLGELPAVRGTELAWNSAGCAEDLPVQFDSLFDEAVTFDVFENGFTLTAANGDGDPHTFIKLDPPEQLDVAPTTEAPATTVPAETTTTEVFITTTGPETD